MIVKLLDLLIAVPKIADLVKYITSQVVIWYISKQNGETLVSIADAASLSLRAKTQEDRINAAKKWHSVLSRARYLF